MATGTLPVSSSTWQRWFLVALVVFFVGLSIQYGRKVLTGDSRSAVVRWHQQLLDLDDGKNIYEQSVYPNPPIMALILIPFAKLPAATGALLWFYLKVGFALVSFHWVFRIVADSKSAGTFPGWAKALTVVLSLRPIMGDLQHGNVNLFILCLVVVALFAFSRGRDITSGIILGLAIACKVTPALFVPYFLWKRAWRTLAGCVIGLTAFFWLVPACFLGWEENAKQLTSWANGMIAPYLVQGKVTSEHNNQSLPGFTYRMLTSSPSFSTYVNDVYTPTEYHNIANWSPDTAKLLIKGCMAGFVVLVISFCRTPISQRGGWRLAAEFSIVLIGMLLFSERTWKHHCVMLVLPFGVLCYRLATGIGQIEKPTRKLMRAYLICTLALAALLMALTSTALPWWHDGAKLAQVYGAYLWAEIAILAALVFLLRSGDWEEERLNAHLSSR